MSPNIYKPELVIFDCDGVLVDSEPVFLATLHRYLRAAGANLTKEECCARFIGKSRSDVEAYLRSLKLPLPSDWPQGFYAQVLRDLKSQCKPIDGIAEALNALEQARVPFCTASNGIREKIELTLSQTKLLSYFEGAVFSAYEIGQSKPAPDVFLHAANAYGKEPQQCVVIEDSPSGLKAAQAAGMRCLAYCTKPLDDLFGAQPFSEMRELPSLLGLNGT